MRYLVLPLLPEATVPEPKLPVVYVVTAIFLDREAAEAAATRVKGTIKVATLVLAGDPREPVE